LVQIELTPEDQLKPHLSITLAYLVVEEVVLLEVVEEVVVHTLQVRVFQFLLEMFLQLWLEGEVVVVLQIVNEVGMAGLHH
jgi:hypothetical protein